jgi:hypothetical protein
MNAGIEIAESGIWLTLGLAEGHVDVNLCDEALVSRTIYTSRTEPDGGGRRLRFLSVLERVGEDTAVTFSNEERPEEPQVVLRGVLAAARTAARALSPELGTLAVVVPGSMNELQRNLVVRTGEAAGWSATRLVNRTLALAVGELSRGASGAHLILAFDHGALEAAVVEVEAGAPQVRSYVSDTTLCSEFLDAALIGQILSATGNLAAESVGGARTFAWLKERVQQVRHRLAFFDVVKIELPDGILGDGQRQVSVSQSDLAALTADWPTKLASRVNTVLREAQREAVVSTVVAGELVRNATVLRLVRDAMPAAFVSIADPRAATRGAVALTDRERPTTSLQREPFSAPAGDTPAPPRQYILRAGLARVAAPTETAEGGLADGIINRARELSRQGKREEAEAELRRLRNYVEALDLSLKDPADVLRGEADRVDAAAGSTRADSAQDPTEVPRSPVDEEKQRRREYLRARDEIIRAEQALKEGRLEQAVAFSHLAYKESTDGRIFRAMIKVHLRAVRQPPTLQNFAEHRIWLVCAVRDDPTNEEVRAALRTRYLAHAEMLASIDKPQAQAEAKKTLDELRHFVEPGEEASALLQRLASAKAQTDPPKDA